MAILIDMSGFDPFGQLFGDSRLSRSAEAAASAIAQVHRRPAALRQYEVISSESLLRGARSGLILDGFDRDLFGGRLESGAVTDELARAVRIAGALAPDRHATTVRTFARAPLQVIAGLDVAAGGDGTPADPQRMQALAQLIVATAAGKCGANADRGLPVVAHAEIVGRTLCGARSGGIGRMVARIAAVTTGFDPRGLAVPEPYLVRHKARYAQCLEDYEKDPLPLLILLFEAWEAGAREAEGIARAL
ncbi:hypothetical protein CENDO_01180 [Corynebacterium endometrii]|uniref:Oxidoreductase n=2 Tax=Corynebacterium endometrii TaxID=2488819 RepID=A0A4P7QDQ6_9CORY|nr:hypothetical protein CENDO_01180 [Corynebacterium endometrii]